MGRYILLTYNRKMIFALRLFVDFLEWVRPSWKKVPLEEWEEVDVNGEAIEPDQEDY